MTNANPWESAGLPHATSVKRRKPMPPVKYPVADYDAAMKVVREAVASYERRGKWRMLRLTNRKLFDAVRWLNDYHGKQLPPVAVKAIAHALGVMVRADRRHRASMCAQIEGRELAAGRRLTAAHLAQRFGVTERTIGRWRKRPEYIHRKEAARRFWTRRKSGELVIDALPLNRTASLDRLPADLSGRVAREAVYDALVTANRRPEPLVDDLLAALAEALRLSAPQK